MPFFAVCLPVCPCQLAAELGVKLAGLFSARKLDEAFAEMDPDESGDVDFEEFATWWGRQEDGLYPEWASAANAMKLCEDALIRTLSRRQHAVGIFTDILNDDFYSPCNSQLYALCGLKVASPSAFELEKRKFQSRENKNTSLFTCKGEGPLAEMTLAGAMALVKLFPSYYKSHPLAIDWSVELQGDDDQLAAAAAAGSEESLSEAASEGDNGGGGGGDGSGSGAE
eukprot:SAG22_NODE_3788_length_1531_cov_1.563547_3_plen_225_part_01